MDNEKGAATAYSALIKSPGAYDNDAFFMYEKYDMILSYSEK